MVVKNKTKESALTSVMEDYLEAIFDLTQTKKVVRVKDIAKQMNVKMPTVSSMLKTLKNRNLVDYEKYEYVELTNAGLKIGKEMRRRHEVLKVFLTDILKIKTAIADEEACKMEHTLSSDTLSCLTDFMNFIQTCPRAGESWLKHFNEYRENGCTPEKCNMQEEKFSKEFKNKIQKLNKKQS